MRNDYEQAIKRGRCPTCGSDVEPGKRRCRGCLDKHSAQKARAKTAGVCVNHKDCLPLPGRTTCQRCAWNTVESSIRTKYGITLEDYAWIEHLQDRKCASCDDRTELVLDHDHATGKVRGLLCGPCNRLIGHAREDVHRLQAAIEYLSGRSEP